MTQIGNGNAKHRITLPDGTEVTIAWAAVTDTGLRREVNEETRLQEFLLIEFPKYRIVIDQEDSFHGGGHWLWYQSG